MIDKIKEVLKSFQNTQANLDSDSTIEIIAQKINESLNEDLEIERMKRSEQIIEHYGDGYIFESPDGGKTVYRRKHGDVVQGEIGNIYEQKAAELEVTVDYYMSEFL